MCTCVYAYRYVYVCMYVCTYMYVLTGGNIIIILFIVFPASFSRISGEVILVLFPICSHMTVWNPKSKDFWE